MHDVFRAFCVSTHQPGTPGCPAEGGPWTAELTTDIEVATDQMRSHNETYRPEQNHARRAFVAVRVGGVFITHPEIF